MKEGFIWGSTWKEETWRKDHQREDRLIHIWQNVCFATLFLYCYITRCWKRGGGYGVGVVARVAGMCLWRCGGRESEERIEVSFAP